MSEMYNTFGFGFLPPDEQQKLIRKNLITTGQIAERDGQTFYTGAGDLRKSKAEKMEQVALGGTSLGEGDFAARKKWKAGTIGSKDLANITRQNVRVGGQVIETPESAAKQFPPRGPVETPINPNFVEKILKVKGGTIQKNWEKSGGFEGMMANPAFTLGLAIMQSSAQGKRLDESLLNNFVKAAGISDIYKQKLKDAGEIIARPTEGEMGDITEYLKDQGYEGPNWFERNMPEWVQGRKGEQMIRSHRRAKELVAIESKKIAGAMAKKGKKVIMDDRIYRQAIANLTKRREIYFKGKVPLISEGRIFESERDINAKATRQHGGPVTRGKTYVVGEGGPEYFLPKQSGKVLSNDDSRIFAMLLASNPQLQNVSRTRAEKILRNRFPEYFE